MKIPINRIWPGGSSLQRFQNVTGIRPRILSSRFPCIKSLTSLSGQESLSPHLEVGAEVRAALAENVPIVALESAIITHGMPFPTNIETALGIQKIIRRKGVVPSTVGVIEGKVKVGLSDAEIEFLGSRAADTFSGKGTVKVSRRDFPFVISKKLNGGTTVAGTLIAASMAGISIFATGGIGGVHRGAESTFDISCDLRELGRVPMAVVSAGVKSILDIGKTLEYLETEGVSVCVVRRSPDIAAQTNFPAFFSAQSQFQSPWVLDNEIQAASMVHASLTFRLGSGILIALPIPKELEASGDVIEAAILAALEKAKIAGISGKEMTPFLLSEINVATGGESLRANRALIENNVSIASDIAIELSRLRRTDQADKCSSGPKGPAPNKGRHLEGPIVPTSAPATEKRSSDGDQRGLKQGLAPTRDPPTSPSTKTFPFPLRSGRPVVIGGSSLDIMLAVEEAEIVSDGRTHAGTIRTCPGGVGRNVAEALAKLDHDPFLITAIGRDPFGETLLENFDSWRMDTGGVLLCSEFETTAIYSAILNSGRECIYGVGDMRLHSRITTNHVASFAHQIKSAPIVLMDGNLPLPTMERVMELCLEHGVPLWFEPTEVRKAQKVLEVSRDLWPALSFMSPNLKELQSLLLGSASSTATAAVTESRGGEKKASRGELETIVSKSLAQFTGLSLILLTCGEEGFIVAERHFQNPEDQRSPDFSLHSFPRPQISAAEVQSVSGAGDCLNAGFISGLLHGMTLEGSARKATGCAYDSLRSMNNVPLAFTKSGGKT